MLNRVALLCVPLAVVLSHAGPFRVFDEGAAVTIVHADAARDEGIAVARDSHVTQRRTTSLFFTTRDGMAGRKNGVAGGALSGSGVRVILGLMTQFRPAQVTPGALQQPGLPRISFACDPASNRFSNGHARYHSISADRHGSSYWYHSQ